MNQLAICIGAQKAGTTWLFKCLEEHTEVCTSTRKETHFFSTRYKRGSIADYEAYYEHCDGYQIRFEASTSYLTDEDVPARIKEYFPEVKLIAVLRDPIERSFSHYLHYQSKKRLRNESLQEAVIKYPEILENSRYEKYLSIYRQYFSEDQLLVIDFEKMKKSPQETIDSVCDFLSVDRFVPTTLRKQYHSTQARSNPLYHKLTKVYRKLKKSRTGRFILKTLNSIGVDALIFDKLMKSTAPKKKVLSESDRTFLKRSLKNG